MHPDDPTMFDEDDIIWDTDTGLLDDDSDEYDCLEDRLAPLLDNLQ